MRQKLPGIPATFVAAETPITTKNVQENENDDTPQGSDISLDPAGGQRGESPSFETPPSDDGDFELLEIKPEWREEAEYRGWTIQHLIRFHVGARVGRARGSERSP